MNQFFASVVFALIFPLIPLFIELRYTGSVGSGALSISAAMYCIAVAVASEHLWLFSIGILVGFFFGVDYGYSFKDGVAANETMWPALLAIVFMFVMHAVERWRRHVLHGRKFLELG